MRNQRPTGITVVAGFLFAATGIAALTGASLLIPGNRLDALWRMNPEAYAAIAGHPEWRRAAGGGLLALGVVTSFLGIGLLRGRRWAWCGAILLFLLDGTGDLVAIAIGPHRAKGLSGILVVSAFLYYLSRKDVRAFIHRDIR